MSNVLTLSNVSKIYNKGAPNEIAVLSGVDLEVPPGQITALIAPSGAGKSTLLHVAGLLDRPTEGEITVDGASVEGLDDTARTVLRRDKIGFVYQFHHLLPEFNAVENVMMPQRAANVKRSAAMEQAKALLKLVGLDHRHSHRPAELSGGEQQRVAICRALANTPKLLLADEPTGNLDPETAEAVFEMLIWLARETGLTALIATHNHGLAERMDRVIELNAGQILAR